MLIALYFVPALRSQVPAAVPVFGKSADAVFRDITSAGLPVTEGEPASADFRSLVKHNACKSSRSFVRSDDDQGWALICVKPTAEAFARLSDAFEGMPALLGPMYVDDNDGEVVVFGLGWPANSSKLVAEAIHADGSYIVDN